MTEYNFSYSEAMKLASDGEAIQQTGWNGKGMFVFMVPAGEYEPVTPTMKAYFKGGLVPYGAYFALKTADNKVVPWQPSQTDMSPQGKWRVIDPAEFSREPYHDEPVSADGLTNIQG